MGGKGKGETGIDDEWAAVMEEAKVLKRPAGWVRIFMSLSKDTAPARALSVEYNAIWYSL